MTPLSKEVVEEILQDAKDRRYCDFPEEIASLCTELLAARESLKDLSFHEDALAHRAVQISRLQRALKVAEGALKGLKESRCQSCCTNMNESLEALTEIAKIRGEK